MCRLPMSVKLLASDAKLLLTQTAEEFRCIGHPGAQQFVREIEAYLSMPDQWDKADTNPGKVSAPAETLKSIFGRKVDGMVFLCANAFFQVKGPYSEEEAKLLVCEKLRKIRRQVDYLQFHKDGSKTDFEHERLPIPEEVRNMVWRRDEGKCVQCGSNHNLEFDHIIPVSKGGSNTARNLQLLCENCNRQKSDGIG